MARFSTHRNIGLADELGSGVRNLYRYVKRYSGRDPELIDGDVFRIIVPLDDSYLSDKGVDKVQKNHESDGNNIGINVGINETQRKIRDLMAANPKITAEQIATVIGVTKRQVESNISKLKELGIVIREGARKNGHWIVSSEHDSKEGSAN